MSAEPAYLSHPHLRDGLLTFTCEDDVWLASLEQDGTVGRPWRITADRARVARPRISPDGATIAWTGWADGTAEVWAAPTCSGAAQRLSWAGSRDTRVLGWLPDGQVLGLSSFHEPFPRYTWAWSVPADGRPGMRLPWGPISDADITESHVLLLTGTAPHEPVVWKRYRGGATGKLWLDGERLLADIGGYLNCPMLIGQGEDIRIAFHCDHEGVGNLYSVRPDGTDLRRHTHHDRFYARNAASDGSRVVYQHAGELWLLPSMDAQAPMRIGRRPYYIPASDNLGGVVCDTTGRGSAVLVRGSLYWLTHRDGPARVLSDTPGVRVRLPQLLGTGRVAWVEDSTGRDGIAVADLPKGEDGTGDPDTSTFAAGQLGRVVESAAARSGAHIATAASDGRLLLVSVPDGAVTEVAHSTFGPVSGLSFSPDSHWLTWSQAVADRSLRRIRLAAVEDPEKIYDVTCGRFEDEQPCFSEDGHYLVFLSWRGFDPVHDVHTGDMSFPLGCRPYLIPLDSRTPAPFAAPVEGRAVNGTPPAPPLEADGRNRVDPEGMASRLTPFPVIASKYSAPAPVRGGMLWLRWPISGALGQTFANPQDTSGLPSLEFFDFARGSVDQLAERVDGYAVSGDGSVIVLVARGGLRLMDLSNPGRSCPIDLSRIIHIVHPAQEWRQAYHDAARIVRDQYWDPGMCGLDWDALTAQYAPLVDAVATPQEFADVLQELLGELSTSHAYVTPSRQSEGPARSHPPQGLLAADVRRTQDGRWLIERVLPGESSDPRARAPLAAHGVQRDDELIEIAGRRVDPDIGPLPLLAGTGGRTIEVTLKAAADGAIRRIAVTPLSDEKPVRYQLWVTHRRALVREMSDGRCGYLHIPDMGASGWAQFNRDLRRELNFAALVLDVRGNAGGNVSQLVLDKLTRKVLAWDFTRDRQPARFPRDALRGPVVALADEATSSDGDMIVAAIRHLGLGPVVGHRTWGGVIGMSGRHTLVDGTEITVPKNAAWFPGGKGFSVENRGVSPDVEVDRGPTDWMEGRHTQLEAAVHLAMDLLAKHPPTTAPPAATPRPDHTRPQLPPVGS
jgi:tricorn protease